MSDVAHSRVIMVPAVPSGARLGAYLLEAELMIGSADEPTAGLSEAIAGKLRRRLLMRVLRLSVGVVALWLVLSVAAAYWLTRRPHRVFAEPPPRVAWGKLQPERLRTRDGQDLGAWYVEGNDQAPAVLLLHGNRGSRRNCLDLAELYARRGWSVLLISLRAHGDSTGEFHDVGYGSREDVLSALAYLERRRPGRQVVVHGMSMGSAVAIFSAGVVGHRVSVYILESPYRDLKTAVRNRTRAALPPGLDWAAYEGLLLVSPLFLPELDRISPLAAAASIPRDVPVLLLGGDADPLARSEETRAIHDRIHDHATLVLFPTNRHQSLLPTAPERYAEAVFAFLDRVLATSSMRREPEPR